MKKNMDTDTNQDFKDTIRRLNDMIDLHNELLKLKKQAGKIVGFCPKGNHPIYEIDEQNAMCECGWGWGGSQTPAPAK